jgi:hypothetical protein
MTETQKRINSTLIDSKICGTLRCYIIQCEVQGREDRAVLAQELLNKFDSKKHAAVLAQHKKADQYLLSALQDYRQLVESQGRADRIAWASQSFVALHNDAIADLRDEFAAKFAELEKQIATLTPTPKKR